MRSNTRRASLRMSTAAPGIGGASRTKSSRCDARARHLLLLTDRGLLRALMLAGGPVAVRFRDWAEGVLLKVARGEQTIADVSLEARRLDLEARRMAIAERRLAVDEARMRTAETIAAARVRVAEANVALRVASALQRHDPGNEALVRELRAKAAGILGGDPKVLSPLESGLFARVAGSPGNGAPEQ
jgi:hypothetical protein